MRIIDTFTKEISEGMADIMRRIDHKKQYIAKMQEQIDSEKEHINRRLLQMMIEREECDIQWLAQQYRYEAEQLRRCGA